MSVRINGLTGIELPDNAHIGSTSDTDSIKFPANGSVEFTQTAKFKDSIFMGTGDIADGNKFSDYEEGTFTPEFGGTSASSGQSYSNNSFYYKKVGSLVYIQGRLTMTNKGTMSGGSNALVRNLPFAHSAGSSGRSGNVQFNSWNNITGSTYSIKSYVPNSLNYLQLCEGTTGSTVALTDLTNTSSVDVSLLYYTDD